MQVRLNSDQQAALEAVQRGENIFLTGPAGSGKSTLVSAIVRWAQRAGKVCDVTAMTGCAALLLGNKAKTLHSWAGIGLGRGTAEQLATDILKSPYAKRRWKRAHILVIDEISMMSPDLFEKLSQVGKRVRGGTVPWGGLQLIVCGDFFQLPPVNKETSALGKFAFDAPAWKAANLQPVVLTRIERQTDTAFQTLLNEARVGTLSPQSIATIKSRQGLNWKEQRIRPTLLFSRNADVDSINDANLAALGKAVHTFEAITLVEPKEDPSVEVPTGDYLAKLVQRMDADSSYVPHLELCEGCQVMLVYNMDLEKGLVNGSRGVVVGFRESDGVPVVQFLHGDPVAMVHNEWVSNDCAILKRSQIPLRVAYAVTIHKSQGATLDCALVDIGSSTFECGQAYVALSRVRDLESLYVHNFNPARIMADPKVVEFYAALVTPAGTEVEPELPELCIPAVPPPTPAIQSPCASQCASQPVEVEVEEELVAPVPNDIADTISIAETVQTETVPVPVTEDILADLDQVTRVEVPKATKKPRAPRKKKEPMATVLESVESSAAATAATTNPTNPTTPTTPTKKPRAPRKKKEPMATVLESVESSAAATAATTNPTTPTTPTKKPRAPRKKKDQVIV